MYVVAIMQKAFSSEKSFFLCIRAITRKKRNAAPKKCSRGGKPSCCSPVQPQKSKKMSDLPLYSSTLLPFLYSKVALLPVSRSLVTFYSAFLKTWKGGSLSFHTWPTAALRFSCMVSITCLFCRDDEKAIIIVFEPGAKNRSSSSDYYYHRGGKKHFPRRPL